MAQRITDRMLIEKVNSINAIQGIGHYYLTRQNDGVALYRVALYKVGADGDPDVFGMGHISNRLLYDLMSAYYKGIQDAKEIFHLSY